MMDFWGEKTFETLHNEFISSTSSGKIFMMKQYENEDTFLGRGVTILLRKATYFMLTLLKEQYAVDPESMIGDIELLFDLVNRNREKILQKHNAKRNLTKKPAYKNRLQLHNVLRKQRSLKPLKFKVKLHKKEEQ